MLSICLSLTRCGVYVCVCVSRYLCVVRWFTIYQDDLLAAFSRLLVRVSESDMSLLVDYGSGSSLSQESVKLEMQMRVHQAKGEVFSDFYDR